MFTRALKVLGNEGLVLGGWIGLNASAMETNAALKTIVRRDTGENYRQMLGRMVKERGIESATDEDLSRMDRKRNGLNSWRGDHEARRAGYNARARISSGVGKALGRS